MPRIGKADEYHEHLEICRQCAERPFDLCMVGQMLLIGVAADAMMLLEQGKLGARPKAISNGSRRAAGSDSKP